jgi:hypothetical protein
MTGADRTPIAEGLKDNLSSIGIGAQQLGCDLN